MLAQIHGEDLKPIHFGGRVLNQAERNYDPTNRELLGCYYAVMKCQIYVLGYEFYVYTDHKPLIYLRTFKDIIRKRYRWILLLEDIGTKILYLPGSENMVADFISRNPTEQKPQVTHI